MGALILVGVVLALLGLAGILGCIVTVARAKRAGLDDSALRERLRKVVAWNLASLLTSALGLGLVTAGALLG